MMSEDKIFHLIERAENIEDAADSNSLAPAHAGGEPPWTPLERRVAKLEDDVGDIKQTLRDLAPRIIETHATMQPMREDIGLLKSQYGEIVRDVAVNKTGLSKEIADTRVALSKEISEIRTEVTEVKGIVSKLPSVATIIGVVIGAIGMVFAGLAVLAYIGK
jgi:hypothetical protein